MGPFGDLHLDADESRPAVFLAGGIGITPFRSMILDSLERGHERRLVLFYSNRSPDVAAYLSELKALQDAQPTFKLVATMTDASEASWAGERGVITGEMLARNVRDMKTPVYYLAGPPAMVRAMTKLLSAWGFRRHTSARRSLPAAERACAREELARERESVLDHTRRRSLGIPSAQEACASLISSETTEGRLRLICG